MSDDYRDPLAAALSRIESLERENAALKNMQSGRPVTAAELEAVRLENELFRIDTQWADAMKTRYGRPIAGTEKPADPATTRRRKRGWIALGAALVFPMVAFVVGGGPVGIAVGGILATGLCVGVLTFFLQKAMAPGIARERARLAKAREPIVKRLAALRGETVPDTEAITAPVRVAVSEAAPTADAEASADDETAGTVAATAKRS